ncbi:MAG: hypothetical protein A2X84_10640 [Desulfuromonadaceae bacterium GWC2_58_13]|nr:MAG: hypothetical protein A2X84_10640 [Desulfuromonadaceae bacterium GWC2_58_13]
MPHSLTALRPDDREDAARLLWFPLFFQGTRNPVEIMTGSYCDPTVGTTRVSVIDRQDFYPLPEDEDHLR